MDNKNTEYRSLSVADLSNSIDSTEKELQRLKFAHAVSPLKNPKSITLLRRDLARKKTHLNEKVAQLLSEKIAQGEITEENIYDHLGKQDLPITLRKSRIKSLFARFAK